MKFGPSHANDLSVRPKGMAPVDLQRPARLVPALAPLSANFAQGLDGDSRQRDQKFHEVSATATATQAKPNFARPSAADAHSPQRLQRTTSLVTHGIR